MSQWLYFPSGAGVPPLDEITNGHSIEMIGSQSIQSVNYGNIADFGIADPRLFSFYFKTPSHANILTVFAKVNVAGHGYGIGLVSPGYLAYFVGDVFFRTILIAVGTTTLYNDNVWHQGVVIDDGSGDPNNFKLIVDGVLDTTVLYNNNPPVPDSYVKTTDDLLVGKLGVTSIYGWKGLLDEMSIWPGVYTQDEIDKIISPTPRDLSQHSRFSDMVLWSRFENNYQDSSSKGNHGVVTGSPIFNTDVP